MTVQRSAHSPNIKERRDHSCAVFDHEGRMVAQAAHVPVHLGAMPMAVQAAIDFYCERTPAAGDVIIVNDPYLGGTHLPDITTVSPVFVGEPLEMWGWVATRAHHADVGGLTPGSMPMSTELFHEGIVIPPLKLVDAGTVDEQLIELICRNVRTPDERRGDLAAQLASHQVGETRLQAFARRYGPSELSRMARELMAYTEQLVVARLRRVPNGEYAFEDFLDDDGRGGPSTPLRVTVTVRDGRFIVDFAGTAAAVPGSLNAPSAITPSAAPYIVRCLAGADVPANDGARAVLDVRVPLGTVLNPQPPHAVAAGNVETSQRIVDVLWGALAQALPDEVPAASQGTMNNLVIGGTDPRSGSAYTYYETIAGGAGAGPTRPGTSGVHVAMTNTLNTPIEALELAYPMRARRYALRPGSGGAGAHRGGNGVVREVEMLAPASVTIVAERRRIGPWGLRGGSAGRRGRDRVCRGGRWRDVPGKGTHHLEAGDLVQVSTPGGGGWGASDAD